MTKSFNNRGESQKICLQWNPLAITFFYFCFCFFSVCGLTSSKMKTEPTEVCQKTVMAKKKEILYLFLYTCLPLKTLSLSLFLSLSVCLSIFFCLLFQAANRLLQRQYCIVPKIKTVNDVCFFGRKEKKYTCSKNYHSLAFWQWFLPLLFWLIF